VPSTRDGSSRLSKPKARPSSTSPEGLECSNLALLHLYSLLDVAMDGSMDGSLFNSRMAAGTIIKAAALRV
jgi:hypothetical protein